MKKLVLAILIFVGIFSIASCNKETKHMTSHL